MGPPRYRLPARTSGIATQTHSETHTYLPVKDRAGSEYCYNCVIEEHQTRAQNLALRMMGEWASAEDATQEAFVSGYRAFGSFRGVNLRSWLLSIVANACRDMLRVRKSRPAVSLDFSPLNAEGEESPLPDPPSEDESPEEYAVRRELGRAIEEGLQSLSEERPLAVVLIDVQGYSYEETSQIMNCSLGTVKSRLARARSGMRDFLREQRELLPTQFRQESG